MTDSSPNQPDPKIPMPSGDDKTNTNPLTTPSDESPDRDTPAWEGANAEDPVGLVDPRREIRTPPGL